MLNLFLWYKITTYIVLYQLVTAPLTRGDILAGVTRDSILELARGWLNNNGPGHGRIRNMTVSERWLTMNEIVQAQVEDRVCNSLSD